MGDNIIGMEDMMSIYEVTDKFGIDRESISVPLEKDGVGSVSWGRGVLEILVPAEIATLKWLPALESELVKLGFERQDFDDAW